MVFDIGNSDQMNTAKAVDQVLNGHFVSEIAKTDVL